MIETLEIERMSFAERLQAMELLWRSMAAEPDKLASPGWHKKSSPGASPKWKPAKANS
jgi:hypothetical protein